MTQKISAKNATLHDLRTHFGLQYIKHNEFFPEWQMDLPDPTEMDKQFLDRVQEGYFNLMEYPPVLEDTIKVAVLSPLIHLAGLLLPPFHIKSEQTVSISAVDDGVTIEGKIDVLVLQEQLWLIVIESKQPSFSIEAGLAQILSYMLARPNPERPAFGMITTGGSFVFIKLAENQYGLSRAFELRNPGNELMNVLSILRRLSLIANSVGHQSFPIK